MAEWRSIILADDGRHASLGRDAEPSEAEITSAATALQAQGLGGWLTIMEGSYHRQGKVFLTSIREVATARCDFAEAVSAFQRMRLA